MFGERGMVCSTYWLHCDRCGYDETVAKEPLFGADTAVAPDNARKVKVLPLLCPKCRALLKRRKIRKIFF
ncbi:MAG: hypothetical protein MJ016_03255 [Victivallaceae bacterium]|nr:hypothetical protein [Victivallaceae bacterium]